jgi:glycosyltransferase involved in cell wall biosynthesis
MDSLAAAAAVNALLADPREAARLGAQGRERVLAHFDCRRGVPELERLFKEAGDGR